jgi:uncharacterized protein (DUF58 family)
VILRQRWRRWQDRRLPSAARIQLDGKRIFILPSRSGVSFVIALILMLLAAINYQNSMAYALVFLLISVFVVAILHTYRNLAGLVLSGGAAPAVFAGEQARFTLRLESLGAEHQAIAAGWSVTELQSVDIDPGHVQQIDLHCAAERRGWLRAPRILVQSSFPLGVLRAWSWVDPGQRTLVYPRPLQGELPISQTPGADPLTDSHHSAGQGVDDFQGLKEYQPGDSWRRMHWKAWSRGGPLLVKDFADLRGDPLCLDFAALGGDTEQRLSRLCFWVLELSRQRAPFALHLPGQQVPLASSDEHRLACLQALALFGQRP